MYFLSPIAASIKMEISSSLVVTIELAKYGTLLLATLFTLLKVTKMLYIVWHLMFPMGLELLQDPSTKLPRSGTQ